MAGPAPTSYGSRIGFQLSDVGVDSATAESRENDVLLLSGVTCNYGGLIAVDRASFTLTTGSTTGLVGPNGAGKTTLLNAISGLAPMTGGSILFDGVELATRPAHRRAAIGLARSYQLIRLFPDLKVVDNVKLGLYTRQDTNFLQDLFKTPAQRRQEREARERAMAALELVDLDQFAFRPARNLSFGQGRRVELARVLVGRPKLMLLDEPTTGVDAAQIAKLANAIVRVRNETSTTILIVEHNLRFVRELCDEVVVMSFGEVLAQGEVNETLADPAVKSAYLGRKD